MYLCSHITIIKVWYLSSLLCSEKKEIVFLTFWSHLKKIKKMAWNLKWQWDQAFLLLPLVVIKHGNFRPTWLHLVTSCQYSNGWCLSALLHLQVKWQVIYEEANLNTLTTNYKKKKIPWAEINAATLLHLVFHSKSKYHMIEICQ